LVAVKTANAEFSDRFDREARAVAALNHPNVAALYDVGIAAGGFAYLVLEYVDGSTLADRIEQGPISIAETLTIARQIAEALEAAHEQGIIHRDLKPANVKVRDDGTVKVLDFGLAKLTDPITHAQDAGLTTSPTLTSPAKMTGIGVILGTAAYMSPEQARGATVDKRTDIWAFGCVLFEMLAGRRAFPGVTVSDTIAAILTREADWQSLPPTTPEAVRRLLRRCLTVDQKRRIRDIGDARIELEEVLAGRTEAPARPTIRRRRESMAWLAVAVLFVALATTGWLLYASNRTTAVRPPVVRTTISLPEEQSLATGSSAYPLALSADGKRVAYVAGKAGQTQLYIRELDALEPKAVPSSNGAAHPFFSPDGEWVGFFAAGALQKAAVTGGAPLRICDVPGVSLGASWGPGDTIVWATRGLDLSVVNAGGGTPRTIPGTKPAYWPQILPDGQTVLFTTGVGTIRNAFALTSLSGQTKRIVARMTDSPLDGPAVLGTGGVLEQAQIVSTGFLVYGQSPGLVRALPFDLHALTPAGSPVSVVDSLERAQNGGAVYFAVSENGLLVYASTRDRHQLVWVDRAGAVTPITADREAFRLPRVSPDGKRIAVAINDETRRSDIWIYDAVRGAKRRLTADGHNLDPVWTPDGSHLTFNGGSGVGVVEMPVDGGGPKVILLTAAQIQTSFAPGTTGYPTTWSPDGRDLLIQADRLDLWRLARGNGVPIPLLTRPYNDAEAQLSVDGHWVAYTSNESGREEIYAARYPDLSNKVAISTEGGTTPRWSRDGREVFYRQDDAVIAVSVETRQTLTAGKPHVLFTGRFTGAGRDPAFDVAADGSRFVMIKSDEASTLRQLTLVQNGFAELIRPPSK
jgi:serine/threonine-protein kinase